MKNKCNIVRDLLPLYVEDMVSVDSASFIEEHLHECSSCKRECENMKNSNEWETFSVKQGEKKQFQKAFQNVKRKLWLVYFGLMLVGLIIGLSLTSGIEVFYNVLIMPVIGIVGYVIFRWKALYKMPALLTVLHVVINFINFLLESYGHDVYCIEFSGLVLYTFIYSIFICIGIVIAGLLHFAFTKEDENNEKDV